MELSRRSMIAAALGAAALTVPALEAAAKQKGSSCIVVGKKIKQLHWKAVV